MKQEKGLSYFCYKPYERGHGFQLKQKQLFYIDILGIDEQSREEIDVEEEVVQRR